MLRALLGLALLLSPFGFAPVWAEPWHLERSVVETLAAPDGHSYRIMVAWPEGEAPANGWPVLWVLDGNENFAVAALTARRLARAGKRSGVEDGVVVAIDSGKLGRRVWDYTPDVPGYAIPEGAPAHGLPVGGADDFLDFLEERVQPMLAEHWHIDSERQAIVGHSFGGLLALQALASGRHWTRYVAVSPSLWFGNGRLSFEPNEAARAREAALLIAAGDREAGPGGSMADSARELVARLKSENMSADFLPLAGQDHGTTMLAAMGRVVAFAFGREEKVP